MSAEIIRLAEFVCAARGKAVPPLADRGGQRVRNTAALPFLERRVGQALRPYRL